MATRRVSIRKILQFFVTVGAVTGCVLALSAAARRQESRTLRGTDLRIANPRQAGFLDVDALQDLLFTRRHLEPSATRLSDLNLRRTEALLRTNPWVAKAQAYVDNQRVLHVRAVQRVPVVRIFETSGASYYLDTALKVLALSPSYTHYAPVITGVSPSRAGEKLRGEILYLVRHIAADSFWSAQVAEIAVSPDGRGFELVPVVGTHRILIGDTSRLDRKLHNVLAFYRGVLNRVGWDRYTILDARYRGQIVASPALAWKAPVDRAATNMNWVETILAADSGVPDSLRVQRPPASPQTPAAPTPARAAAPAPTAPKPAPARDAAAPKPAPRAASRPAANPR